MPDTFDDLTALAAKIAPTWDGTGYARSNGGLGMLVRIGTVWSYPGAPQDGVNLRLPTDNLPDPRVQAAITAEAWAVYRVDAKGRPDIVVPAGSALTKQGPGPLQPVDIGSARSLDSSRAHVGIRLFRGTPIADLGYFKGLWERAFAAGLTPSPDGQNLETRHLVFRIVGPVLPSQPTPAVGDQIRFDEGTRYRVTTVTTDADGGYTLILARLSL